MTAVTQADIDAKRLELAQAKKDKIDAKNTQRVAVATAQATEDTKQGELDALVAQKQIDDLTALPQS